MAYVIILLTRALIARALAVWLSPNEGQRNDPGDGSIWCDVSKNPEDCLNMSYWEMDKQNNQIVLNGSLVNAIKKNPAGISIFIPEGFDVNMPINNNVIRFKISDGMYDNCAQFLKDGTSPCNVDSGWFDSWDANAKITVSGLGRISGWYAMKWQKENNVRMWKDADGDIDAMTAGSDFSDWKGIGEWYMSGKGYRDHMTCFYLWYISSS